MDKLQAQLKGLNHASQLFRRQAAFGVFALLRSQPATQREAVQDVILTCLSSRHPDVVEESVSQLLQFTSAANQPAVINTEDALHVLLLAITSAGAATASVLANGLVPLSQQLLQNILSSSSSSSVAAAATVSAKFPPGSRHPLCSALLTQPAAAAAIITAAVNWLAAVLRNATPDQLAAAAAAYPGSSTSSSSIVQVEGLSTVWQCLRPFFSYVLSADISSSSSSSGVGPAAASLCLSQLLCVASCAAGAAELLLPFLLRQMLLWRMDTAAARLATIQAVSDVLDVLTNHKPTHSSSSSSKLPVWWRSACGSTGSLLLLLAARSVSPAAAGGATGSSVGLILDLMWRLAGVLLPGLWQQQLLTLAWLLLCCSGQQEQSLITKIIFAQITHRHSSKQQEQQEQQQQHTVSLHTWQTAALQFPLLQQLVFSTNTDTKMWAAAALTQISQQQQQQQQQCWVSTVQQQQQQMAAAAAAGERDFESHSQQGPLASVTAIQGLLELWWSDDPSSSSSSSSSSRKRVGQPPAALDWLHTLHSTLSQIKQAGSSSSTAAAAAGSSGRRSDTTALTVPLPAARSVRDLEDQSGGDATGVFLSSGNAAWFSSHGVNPAVLLLLAALLQHRDHDVVLAAVDVLQNLVLLVPQIAPGFVPLVLQQLRSMYRLSSSSSSSSGSARAAQCTASLLLLLLPAMCKDTATAALVWRMLQPVLTAVQSAVLPDHIRSRSQQQQLGDLQGLVRSVAVQLAVQSWKLTGRGWTRAEAAVNGCVKPQNALGPLGAEPLELKLLRATSLRDVISISSARGLELLGTLQSCLQDTSTPTVQALALQSLDLLFARDDLDFYKAWPVVARLLPPRSVLGSAGIEPGSHASKPDYLNGKCNSSSSTTTTSSSSSSSSSTSGSYSTLSLQSIVSNAGLHTARGLVAAHWVGLLRYGVVDAGAEADVAVMVVQLMWMATAATEAQVVRAAAYSSLAAWPIALFNQLELPVAAAAFTAPLAAEAAALAAAIWSLQPPRQQQQQRDSVLALEAHRSAIAAAERLAAAAIVYEHSNRRQFLAAAGAAARGAGSSSSSSAAIDREEAALRHRLIRGLPQQLTATAAAEASPGALLLLWQPGSSSSNAAAAAGGSEQDQYACTFADISSRWSSSSGAAVASSSAVVGCAGMSAAAWEAFMRRWLIATGHTADPILSKIAASWRSGLPGAAAAGIAAAAGLAAAGALSEAQVVDLVEEFAGLLTGNSRSSSVAAAAASSLARLLPTLHPSDWEHKQMIVNTLCNTLLGCCQNNSGSSSSTLAAAVVEAVGYSAVCLLIHQQDDNLFEMNVTSHNDTGNNNSINSAIDRGLALSCSCLGMLLSIVKALSAAAAAASSSSSRVVDDVMCQLPGSHRDLITIHDLDLDHEAAAAVDLAAAAVKGTCCALLALHKRTAAAAAAAATTAVSRVADGRPPAPTAAAAAATFGHYILDQLSAMTTDHSSSNSSISGSAAAWHTAVIAAIPAAIAGAAAAGSSDTLQQQLSGAVDQCKQLAQSVNIDARVAAAAAASWSRLVCIKMALGPTDQQELHNLVSWLAAAAAAQPTAAAATAKVFAKPATGSTVVRVGAAADLALLLGVDTAAGSSGEWMTDLISAAAAAAAVGGSSNLGSGVAGSARHWGLLGPAGSNTLQRLQLARTCLKALESAAAVRTGSSSSSSSSKMAPLAGWLLAAASVAGGNRLAGSSSSSVHQQRPTVPPPAAAAAAAGSRRSAAAAAAGAASPALNLYPATGALRPLAEKALGYNSSPGLLNPAIASSSDDHHHQQLAAAFEAAACIRCLAAAPRLPSAEWAGLCRRLLTLPAVMNSGQGHQAAAGNISDRDPQIRMTNLAICQLQVAAVRLLIAHCQNPGLELSGVIDACLNPAAFTQLNPMLQSLLLRHLGTALSAMPISKAAVVVQGLPSLVDFTIRSSQQQQQQQKKKNCVSPAAGPTTVDLGFVKITNPQRGLLITLSAWAGLTNLCQAAEDGTSPNFATHKSLMNALHNAVSGMAALLPLLPDQVMHQQIWSQIAAGTDLAQPLDDLFEQQQRQHCWGIHASHRSSGSNSSSSSGACGSSSSSSSGCDHVLQQWSAAVNCLKLLNPDVLNKMTASAVQPLAAVVAGQQQQVLLAIQLRSILVIARKLSWKDLAGCKHVYLGQHSTSSSSDSSGIERCMPPAGAAAAAVSCPSRLVLLPVALACASAPQAGLLQQLQELAAAAAVSAAAPDNAVVLAAAMLTAWLVAGSSNARAAAAATGSEGGAAATAAAVAAAAAAEAQIMMTDLSKVVDQLPAILPQLLSSHQVAGSRQWFADAVARVLLNLRAQPGLSAAAAARLLAAVAAVREMLPANSSCWQDLLLAV